MPQRAIELTLPQWKDVSALGFSSVAVNGTADEPETAIGPLEIAEQIQETSRLVSIGELTSGVAHEINNPLSIVAGFAELMMDYSLPHPFQDYVQKIYDESHRAANIVQNLLEFSRKSEVRREFKSVQFVIRRALELKQHEFRLKNIEIVTDWPRNLPRTMIYERQLTQAVLNVLNNAEQALSNFHKSGQLPGDLTSCITIRARAPAGQLLIKISDNGPGMPQSHLDRIFDPFFTTKGEGTGLGLSDCRRIVELHGGKMWAESHLGSGSAFFMLIPVLRLDSQ